MPVTDPKLLSQAHLTGEVSCTDFQPHFLKANICINCNKLITKHAAASIPNDQVLLKALEYSQEGEKVPSCVLDKSDQLGSLYLGGYRAVMNLKFLKEHNVTHILNTAKGLEIFGPKYLEAVEQVRRELNIQFLNTNWMDSTDFVIDIEELVNAVNFIHAGLHNRGSVLVHCAQGKSRSTTAVVAYVMAIKSMSSDEALALVKEKRKMAEPNPTFTLLLKKFERSEELKKIQIELQ